MVHNPAIPSPLQNMTIKKHHAFLFVFLLLQISYFCDLLYTRKVKKISMDLKKLLFPLSLIFSLVNLLDPLG